MARTTPQVRNGVLVYHGETQLETVPVGSAAWRRWLDDARTTTFRVNHPLGSFTARKEQRQRGGSYWYAYRKQGGRRHKGYLGRAEELTLQRTDTLLKGRLDGLAVQLKNKPDLYNAYRTARRIVDQPGTHATKPPAKTITTSVTLSKAA